MSTHKHIDEICLAIISLTLALTIIFINGEKFGIETVSNNLLGYENRIFDTSKVHTIDIVMDDTESFFENAEKEEYTLCAVIIDGEKISDTGIRAKGNTSLSQVKNYGNNRYSLKIEFDCFDSTGTYHGLDKLCLNNIIQDNTYMKDYLTYTMMNYAEVSAPLCSYAYVTINGEDFGLFLAVESVEDSFLKRNYNSEGNLYKPDSSDMGGGKGNGRKFDMDAFSEKMSDASSDDKNAEKPPEATQDNQNNGNMPEQFNSPPQKPENMPDDFTPPDGGGQNMMPPGGFNGNPPEMPEGAPEMNSDIPQTPADMPEMNGEAPKTPESSSEAGGETAKTDENIPEKPNGNFGKDNFGGGMGDRGSRGTSLVYTDDSFDSYSDIFDNAKTKVTSADKTRLIASIKKLNENKDIEEAVDIDSVIRYFTVHNFVLNFDSYTGQMLHNYYLYENDGIMSMIPWDYNLAFGGFQSHGTADSYINYPIDTPVSGGDMESRPMLSWIFSSEEYSEKYHKYFSKFISEFFDSGYFEKLIDETVKMISPYVEKDPTKFCTYDEFQKGADTLKNFCLLRSESVKKQLSGEIPSTSKAQQKDSSSFISSGGISISDMGSMENSMDKNPFGSSVRNNKSR